MLWQVIKRLTTITPITLTEVWIYKRALWSGRMKKMMASLLL
jgi:hypothetical protein